MLEKFRKYIKIERRVIINFEGLTQCSKARVRRIQASFWESRIVKANRNLRSKEK